MAAPRPSELGGIPCTPHGPLSQVHRRFKIQAMRDGIRKIIFSSLNISLNDPKLVSWLQFTYEEKHNIMIKHVHQFFGQRMGWSMTMVDTLLEYIVQDSTHQKKNEKEVKERKYPI